MPRAAADPQDPELDIRMVCGGIWRGFNRVLQSPVGVERFNRPRELLLGPRVLAKTDIGLFLGTSRAMGVRRRGCWNTVGLSRSALALAV